MRQVSTTFVNYYRSGGGGGGEGLHMVVRGLWSYDLHFVRKKVKDVSKTLYE